MILAWAAAGITGILVVWIVIIYNRFIFLKNQVESAWSQIDVQLKRRYDLIPNLVSAVRGYMQHEKDLIETVVNARAAAMTAARLKERAAAEAGISDSLGSLFAVMEQYPILRASENVMHLQEELVTAENRIAFARQLYNDLVANYMTMLGRFPDMFIASLFAFRPFEYFRASASDRLLPDMPAGSRKSV
jgi:LemA protein